MHRHDVCRVEESHQVLFGTRLVELALLKHQARLCSRGCVPLLSSLAILSDTPIISIEDTQFFWCGQGDHVYSFV